MIKVGRKLLWTEAVPIEELGKRLPLTAEVVELFHDGAWNEIALVRRLHSAGETRPVPATVTGRPGQNPIYCLAAAWKRIEPMIPHESLPAPSDNGSVYQGERRHYGRRMQVSRRARICFT